jgi:hypothetical protein
MILERQTKEKARSGTQQPSITRSMANVILQQGE